MKLLELNTLRNNVSVAFYINPEEIVLVEPRATGSLITLSTGGCRSVLQPLARIGNLIQFADSQFSSTIVTEAAWLKSLEPSPAFSGMGAFAPLCLEPLP